MAKENRTHSKNPKKKIWNKIEFDSNVFYKLSRVKNLTMNAEDFGCQFSIRSTYKDLSTTSENDAFVPVRSKVNLKYYCQINFVRAFLSDKFHTFVKCRPHTTAESEMLTA